MFKIGIDIGGTKINTGLFSASEKTLLANKKAYIAEISDLCTYIKTVIEELCRENGICPSEVLSVGIGIPGTVRADGKKILKAPNISLLSDDIAVKLEETLKLPVCFVQDSRAAAWGEYLCGGGKGAESVVCVTLGTGIGTGIVLGGKIYAGALGCAGELGHLPVAEGGRPCGCGKAGCLEKYCAGGGLDITAKELLGEGKTAADLFAQAKAGNEQAQAAIQDAVQMLGAGLVSIINLLSPACLLFSGGLSAQEELYLNPLMEYIKSHCYKTDTLPVIKKAALNELSPLYGAAFIPMPEKRKPRLKTCR